MNRVSLRNSGLVLVLTLGYSILSLGSPLEELQASGRLRIESSLSPLESIVPGQKVVLTIKVVTDRWFTGGTRIGIPEVPGLVILQTEQFANNASETIEGQTWVVQSWTLDIFPQRAGDFTVGPIPLQLKVNAEPGRDVEGNLFGPALQFSVSTPEILAQAEHWVAAPSFTVSQNLDKSLDALKVGDAFEQEILFEATDVLAMMLPTYESQKQEGLAIYPSPPSLDNDINRGKTLASRTISVSYVIEQPGDYLLPAREYFWWNTQSSELELVSLPETRFNVVGAGTRPESGGKGLNVNPRLLLILAVGLAVASAIVGLAWIFLPRLPLTRWVTTLSELLRRLRALGDPALATKLNPENSAEK